MLVHKIFSLYNFILFKEKLDKHLSSNPFWLRPQSIIPGQGLSTKTKPVTVDMNPKQVIEEYAKVRNNPEYEVSLNFGVNVSDIVLEFYDLELKTFAAKYTFNNIEVSDDLKIIKYKMIIDIDYTSARGRVTIRLLVPYSLEVPYGYNEDEETLKSSGESKLKYYWAKGITCEDDKGGLFKKFNTLFTNREWESLPTIETDTFSAREFNKVTGHTSVLVEIEEDTLDKFAFRDIIESDKADIIDMMSVNLGHHVVDSLLEKVKELENMET